MKKIFALLFTLLTINVLGQTSNGITSPYGTFVGCRPTSVTLIAPSGYDKYLWSIQRTSETWNDPKIYQIEILDDSIN